MNGFSGCGIAGVLHFNAGPTHHHAPESQGANSGSGYARAEDVGRVVGALAHRGPHGTGVWQQPDLALAHCRLAVIGLGEAGAQPMTRDHVTITYNGELYNYRELRDELRAMRRGGFTFTSQTDTEVVLRAWQAWGPRALDRFVGMYAFALWDARTRRLHLVRDRFGIKPLYVHRGPRHLAFASEVEALLQFPGIEARPDLDAVADHLLYSSTLETDPTRTLVHGITALPPATQLTVAADGRTTTRTYWELDRAEPSIRAAGRQHGESERWPTAAGECDGDATGLARLLDASVSGMLATSDTPVALLLSGGLDSALVAALAARGLAGPHRPREPGAAKSPEPAITAVTMVHAAANGRTVMDAQNPDLRHSRQVVTHLTGKPGRAIDHRVEVHPTAVTLDDIDAVIDLAALADDPRHLASLTAYRRIAALGRRVVLIGQGADEIMAGYVELPSFRQSILDVRHPDPATITGLPASRQTSHLSPNVLARRHHAHARILAQYHQLPGEPLERAHRLLVETQLRRILQFEDFLSMRSSVEARLPYLDHRLVEHCFTPPFHRHVHPPTGRGKRALRLAARHLLPPTVITRPKAVFPHPDNALLHHRLSILAQAHDADLRRDPLIAHLFALPAPGRWSSLPARTLWLMLTTWRWHHRLTHPHPHVSGSTR